MITKALLMVFLIAMHGSDAEAVDVQPLASNPYAVGATCVYGIVGSSLLIRGLDGVSRFLISDCLADALDYKNQKYLARWLRTHADNYAKEEEKSPLKAWSKYIGLLLGSAVSICIAYRTWRQQSVLQPYQQAYETLVASSAVRGCATLGYLMASVALIFRGFDGISGGALGEFMSDFLEDYGWKVEAKWFRDKSADLMIYEETAPVKAWLSYFANCFMGGLAIVSAYRTLSAGIEAPYMDLYDGGRVIYKNLRQLCMKQLIARQWIKFSQENSIYFQEVDWFLQDVDKLTQSQPQLGVDIKSIINQLNYVAAQVEILQSESLNIKNFQTNVSILFSALTRKRWIEEALANQIITDINTKIFSELHIESMSKISLQLGGGTVKASKCEA